CNPYKESHPSTIVTNSCRDTMKAVQRLIPVAPAHAHHAACAAHPREHKGCRPEDAWRFCSSRQSPVGNRRTLSRATPAVTAGVFPAPTALEGVGPLGRGREPAPLT